MAKKKLTAIVKIQIPAGKATPAPPVVRAICDEVMSLMELD